jgi:hypothetical protein
MQYNSHSTNQDIVTMAEKLTKTNSVSFPIEDKTLYANEGSRIIWSWIHESYGGWLYDDKNNTDLPEATTTLVSGQSDYTLPTDASVVVGVSYKDTGGNWHKLSPVTIEQIQDGGSEEEFYNTDGMPVAYRPLGNVIKIYPAANFTQTASLKLYYNRDISAFTTTDTTKTPGFDSAYHEAVPTYMALQYARINQLPNKADLELQWAQYESRIKKDFARRFAELFPPRITTRDAVEEYS